MTRDENVVWVDLCLFHMSKLDAICIIVAGDDFIVKVLPACGRGPDRLGQHLHTAKLPCPAPPRRCHTACAGGSFANRMEAVTLFHRRPTCVDAGEAEYQCCLRERPNGACVHTGLALLRLGNNVGPDSPSILYDGLCFGGVGAVAGATLHDRKLPRSGFKLLPSWLENR